MSLATLNGSTWPTNCNSGILEVCASGYPQMVLLFVQLLGICILSSWTPWMSYQTLGTITYTRIPSGRHFWVDEFSELPKLAGIWIRSVEGYLLKIFFPSKPSFAEERCHHLPLRGNPWCRLRHPLPFKALTALLPELSVTSTEEGLVLWILRSWLIPGFQLLSIKEYQKHLISTNSRHEHDFFLDVFFWRKNQGAYQDLYKVRLLFLGSSRTVTTFEFWKIHGGYAGANIVEASVSLGQWRWAFGLKEVWIQNKKRRESLEVNQKNVEEKNNTNVSWFCWWHVDF